MIIVLGWSTYIYLILVAGGSWSQVSPHTLDKELIEFYQILIIYSTGQG